MDEARLVNALLQLGVLVFSLCLHEFGHALAANKLGDPTAKMLGRLTIDPRAHVSLWGTLIFPMAMILFPGLPLIGWAKPVPVTIENFRNPRRDMSLVAIAGPAANLFLVALSILTLKILQQSGFQVEEGMAVSLLKMLNLFMMINFFLAVFNLIPIPPLDGGWLLKAVLPGKWSYWISRMEPYSLFIFIILLQFKVLYIFFIPAMFVFSMVLNAVGLPDSFGMM
jgi:Zn-dependent protease